MIITVRLIAELFGARLGAIALLFPSRSFVLKFTFFKLVQHNLLCWRSFKADLQYCCCSNPNFRICNSDDIFRRLETSPSSVSKAIFAVLTIVNGS